MTNSLNKDKLLKITEIITPQSLFYIQKIGEYKGKQVLYPNQQPEYLDKLQIKAIINNTISSNAIDNVLIDYDRFIELFEEIREPETDVEAEVVRYIKVLYLINSHNEALQITPDLVLQFHRNLFRYKPEQGGRWKPLDNVIERINRDGTTSVTFIPVSAADTPSAIEDLCHSYSSLIQDKETIDLIVIAAFLLDFLCIHPFTVGNGRISRLFAQLLLYKCDYQVAKYIPIDKIIFDNKSKYIYNLNKSSQGWHTGEHELSFWVEFFLGAIYTGYKNLDNRIFHIKSKKGAKSQQVKMVIDTLPANFKVADVVDKCPGISRPTINKVLQELRDDKLVAPASMGRDAVWEKLY